jgi:hypothetical protein
MKKYILYLIGILSFLFACGDDEDVKGGMEPVTEVECTPFIGSVAMKWKNPVADDYYYTLLSYKNAAGETVNKKVSRYSADADGVTSALVTGFTDTNEYEFTLTAYGVSGVSSVPVLIKGTPDECTGAAAYVMESVGIEATEAGARLSWTNKTEVEVTLHLSYINGLGMFLEEEVDATLSGSHAISDLEIGETEFTIYAQNVVDGKKTPSKTITVASIVDPRDIIQIWYDPDRKDPVNFDCGTVGINSVEIVDEYSYKLTLDPTVPERYIIWEPLGSNIRRNDLSLSFQYRCADSFSLTLLYYPFDWDTIAENYKAKGTLSASTEWKTVSFDIKNDIETLPGRWGTTTSQYRFIFGTEPTVEKNVPVTFEIRNIKLRPGK